MCHMVLHTGFGFGAKTASVIYKVDQLYNKEVRGTVMMILR
jgi:hypothetical protein